MKLIDVSTPKYPNTFAIVSNKDFGWLNKRKWFATKIGHTFYVMERHVEKNIYMHREILNAPKNLQCDHKDRNGLNNQRENIRLCTRSQNRCNQAKINNNGLKYKGYYFRNGLNKPYMSKIQIKNKNIYLGYYKTEIEAALAYNEAAKKYHGDFASLNEVSK